MTRRCRRVWVLNHIFGDDGDDLEVRTIGKERSKREQLNSLYIYIYNQQFKQGGGKFCWHLSSSTSDSELEFPSCWGWGGVGGSGRTTTPADGGGGDAARRSQDTLLCNNSD
jgi:hypothetical protein